jgi:hypothetical protein
MAPTQACAAVKLMECGVGQKASHKQRLAVLQGPRCFSSLPVVQLCPCVAVADVLVVSVY